MNDWTLLEMHSRLLIILMAFRDRYEGLMDSPECTSKTDAMYFAAKDRIKEVLRDMQEIERR